MSQAHPPIPEPQPHTAGDGDPRTQSILLPPSQRPADAPEDGTPGWQQEHGWTGEPAATDFPQSDTGEFSLPGQPARQAQPGPEATGAQPTGPVDFVPGFGTDRSPAGPPPVPPAGPNGSSTATLPPPRPAAARGPVTSPGGPTEAGSRPRRTPPASARRGRRGGPALVSLVLGVIALVLLQLGLALDFGNQSLWEVVPTWSALATVAALAVLVPAVAALTGRLPVRTAWQAGAAGVAALAVVWVLVALPLAASDRGFWLTAALAAAAGALWTAPGRSR
jgi:hypothetical protein